MKVHNRNIVAWLLVLPAVAPVVLTLILIVVMAIAQSVGLFNFGAPAHFTLQYWETILNDSQLWRATGYSLKIGVVSAVLSVALALPLALWLRKPFPGSVLMSGLLKAPLMVHGLVAALLFINLISWQGFINLGLLKLGIISQPIRMQNDRWGIGVIILQVWKQLPYALLIITGSLRAIGDEIVDAARDLGAGKTARLLQIILPLSIKAVQVSLILIFIGALGDFSFQVVAGPTSVFSLSQYMLRFPEISAQGWNLAAVVAVILMLAAFVGAVVLAGVAKWLQKVGEHK
ncbi:putative spermidine/putrescine transport system permease protein [Pantoea sp. PNA 14-12]|uniref:Spermidine/putrescine ABC transporter permease n=1 Tax=Pantoea stewartii TaxID=66269 RepID=A0AB34VE20_9GAMM|nr:MULTISPECIES: ABC transporter permease subunit [Pantoea]KKW49438.1 spermidine/putrescine ABC transporter permease [Pantoea ananatis]KHE02955.1 spermidine/putrescine ABC transporter permease [Pantoea stewartii]KHN60096.1 spermidine/putrescine ABC transporter permease [Pantoea stewartii]KTS75326.1 spermidine/putrescine ABC transporter permease [Pantoea stewartii]KTS95251.1 spermidine/putrescine ABC transporter permease [Pantoea stewartii]